MKKQKFFTVLVACALLICSVFTTGSVAVGACSVDTKKTESPVPMVKSVHQIGDNALEVVFDQAVDGTKAVKPENYWVQSLSDKKPSGIATLGKKDKINADNSLTSKTVQIEPKDSTNTVFVLTFKDNITTNGKYRVIVCYITVPGAGDFTGDNGAAEFVGK